MPKQEGKPPRAARDATSGAGGQGAGSPPRGEREIRAEIAALVGELCAAREAGAEPFEPGTSPVPYAGRVFDEREIQNLVDAALDGTLTLGRYGRLFEERLKRFLGVPHATLANSGSSANLLAVAALASPLLDRPLAPGDEVITVAASFPTTIAPLLFHQLVPVFLDVDGEAGNLRADLLEEAVTERTRAVMVAHTLGVPFDLDRVQAFCRKYNLFLVEDACDALGSRWRGRPVGTFGDLATFSFYPAHQITMGEGGAVVCRSGTLFRALNSIRDWGRDCWCEPGNSNTCGKRFEWKLGDLPDRYDHKYIYSHKGFNLKPLDLAAAVGAAQIEKLPAFVEARRRNFETLRAALVPYERLLRLPKAPPGTEPCWFGLLVTVRDGAPFTRDDLVAFLEGRRIATRMLFAGNLLRQPGYREIPHRVVGSLDETERIMRQAFFVGVYPGLGKEQIDYMIDSFRAFFAARGM